MSSEDYANRNGYKWEDVLQAYTEVFPGTFEPENYGEVFYFDGSDIQFVGTGKYG